MFCAKVIFPVVCAVIFFFPRLAFAQGLEYFDAGRKAYDSGDFDRAIERFTAAIKAGDLGTQSLSMAYNNRGLAYGSKKDYDRALADYNDAIRLNPKNGDAY